MVTKATVSLTQLSSSVLYLISTAHPLLLSELHRELKEIGLHRSLDEVVCVHPTTRMRWCVCTQPLDDDDEMTYRRSHAEYVSCTNNTVKVW